jgi:hypothetical protein
MLAPSATASTPFLISAFASVPVNSFWVAQGNAILHGTCQIEPPLT